MSSCVFGFVFVSFHSFFMFYRLFFACHIFPFISIRLLALIEKFSVHFYYSFSHSFYFYRAEHSIAARRLCFQLLFMFSQQLLWYYFVLLSICVVFVHFSFELTYVFCCFPFIISFDFVSKFFDERIVYCSCVSAFAYHIVDIYSVCRAADCRYHAAWHNFIFSSLFCLYSMEMERNIHRKCWSKYKMKMKLTENKREIQQIRNKNNIYFNISTEF